MCGIAGIHNLRGGSVPFFAIKKMCDAMAHRGPDDAGYVLFTRQGHWKELSELDFLRRSPDLYTDPFESTRPPGPERDYALALGHRRLSIIDLSPAGHQPMANENREIWIVYNGELYNFLELREALIQKGHRFTSRTDTEVILHLYEEHGEECVERLNGIFAFAIWDAKARKLLLARDRYGAKPLYYTQAGPCFLFASEIKALLECEGVSRELNPCALADYFTFQNTFGKTTLLKGISLLEPGHLLVLENGRMRSHAYWDFSFEVEEDRGEAYYTDQVRALLEKAVARQLIGDVPVGTYLSGGMDSGSMTALAARHVPRLMTFTGGFDLAHVSGLEATFDERVDAELMASTFGTEHYQMVIHAGDFEWALPQVIWHLEDLRVGMCYQTYYIARLASKFVKVVLAGTGGDEVFAGYPWRYRHVQEARTHAEFNQAYYRYWMRLIPEEDREAFFTREILYQLGDYSPYESFTAISERAREIADPIGKALYFEAKTFLHGLLVVEDKLSMAHSLEARVPLLDNDLIDRAMRIPKRHLINYTWHPDENMAGKYIFRKAMQGTLPDPILRKRKQGFSAPDQSWYRVNLIDYIRETLLSRDSLVLAYIQKRYIEKVLEDHVQGRINHRLLIWGLLSFEWWCRLIGPGSQGGAAADLLPEGSAVRRGLS
ncbi:MAG: asparagine synthase (glutamine-hydrolyzing) [Candidatus Tectomicrobia bacterium]|uniref:asparagine synthase (glutamine-hydrolyzing) n=1 Tax=Tectimicrobiota bacterium TaxID=2528274 RepID=A0A932FXB8_UNCTE|nr:asparagine synthase (glutamine-hydrolyzing) [Candidatus Tectomicrobia bacterium]